MRVLTVNAGSSSLKLRIIGANDDLEASVDLPRPSPETVADDLGEFVGNAPPLDAVGHRIVHGGHDFRGPVSVDERVERAIEDLADLAPLHNPPAIEAVRIVRQVLPEVPQVACFDTAFHADLPAEASTYALPHHWNTRWRLRRFGFHGLSHAYAARRAAELMGRPVAALRLVTAHLGSGASLAAVKGGRSVDTTMGFTPLAGLVMATRPGDVDPGLVLWLLRSGSLSGEEVEDALENDSGLLGLSGVSSDLRLVLDAADDGDDRAALAYGVYLHRLRAGIASMVAAIDGLDGLVFTGGVGENSARLRRDACGGLMFLGLGPLNEKANEQASGDRLISSVAVGATTFVVSAREDIEIARQVREVLA